MLRGAISAFTRVFDALCFAAWCAADSGSMRRGGGSGLCGAALHAAPRPRDTLMPTPLPTPLPKPLRRLLFRNWTPIFSLPL